MARCIRGHPGISQCVSRYGILACDFRIRLLRRSIMFRARDLAHSFRMRAPLNIALGIDKNYIREAHLENGLFRRTISIGVVNTSADDIHNCNIKLIQASPAPMIGDSKAALPIFFIPNFDLSSGKRKYVEIISLVESGWQVEWQKHSITVRVGVGRGWVSKGWTTLSPLPTQGNPVILMLEAFAPRIASSQAQVKIWVDETLGRKLYARID
jgi:hypothetical protein